MSDEFCELAAPCLQRFLEQNGRARLPAEVVQSVCRGVWETAVAEGLPRPLAPGESGTPGEMSAETVNRLLSRALAGVNWPAESGEPPSPGYGVPSPVATAVRQLLKACLQPEFLDCRGSYREVIKGRCRRQEAEKARERISGSHCVDCPYWNLLSPERHEVFLAAAWCGDQGEFHRSRDLFLPEDYRRLAQFLHRERRSRGLRSE